MFYGKEFKIIDKKKRMILVEKGKKTPVLQAQKIFKHAPNVSPEDKGYVSLFVTVDRQSGMYDLFNASENRMILRHLEPTSYLISENGVPMVFTLKDQNLYVTPDGEIRDLNLNTGSVYFSLDADGNPTHDIVFKVLKGSPVVLYRSSDFSARDIIRHGRDNLFGKVARMPQDEIVENPFLPLLMTNSEDLLAFVQTYPNKKEALMTLAMQYKRIAGEDRMSTEQYLQAVATRFREIATSKGRISIESLNARIAENDKKIEDLKNQAAPYKQEATALVQTINAINQELGEPEYDYFPDGDFFDPDEYDELPLGFETLPAEVQKKYETRKQLMTDHQELYDIVDGYNLEVSNLNLNNYHTQQTISTIEYCEDLDTIIKTITLELGDKQASTKVQPSTEQQVAAVQEESTQETAAPKNTHEDNPTE